MSPATKEIGSSGERQARNYLEKINYRFIAANWLCKLGEIDLIMQDGSTRVFIEVRVRSSASFGDAVDSVTSRKQQRLLRAARLYQQMEDYWGDCRFDVLALALDPANDSVTIEHIQHAFGE